MTIYFMIFVAVTTPKYLTYELSTPYLDCHVTFRLTNYLVYFSLLVVAFKGELQRYTEILLYSARALALLLNWSTLFKLSLKASLVFLRIPSDEEFLTSTSSANIMILSPDKQSSKESLHYETCATARSLLRIISRTSFLIW